MDSNLKVAIIEDNDDLREAIVSALEGKVNIVYGFDSAESLIEMMRLDLIDLAVIDLGLPGEDGILLSGRLRSIHPDIGIIMMTARSKIADRIIGYESGADIYLTKPLDIRELISAIYSLSRRLISRGFDESQIKIDLTKSLLCRASRQVSLSNPEILILRAFLENNHKLEIRRISEILNIKEERNLNAIRVFMFRLNRKFKDLGLKVRPIRGLREKGYQLSLTIILKNE